MSSNTPSVGLRASVIVGLVAVAAAIGAMVANAGDDAEADQQRRQQLRDAIVCIESDFC